MPKSEFMVVVATCEDDRRCEFDQRGAIKVCSVGLMCFGVGLRELFANASDAMAAAGLSFEVPQPPVAVHFGA